MQSTIRAIEQSLGDWLAGMPRKIDADLLHGHCGIVRDRITVAGGGAGGDDPEQAERAGLSGEEMLEESCGHGTAADIRRADD